MPRNSITAHSLRVNSRIGQDTSFSPRPQIHTGKKSDHEQPLPAARLALGGHSRSLISRLVSLQISIPSSLCIHVTVLKDEPCSALRLTLFTNAEEAPTADWAQRSRGCCGDQGDKFRTLWTSLFSVGEARCGQVSKLPVAFGMKPKPSWEAFQALQGVGPLVSFLAFSHICSRTFQNTTCHATGILYHLQFIRRAMLICGLAFAQLCPLCGPCSSFFSFCFPRCPIYFSVLTL